MSCRKHGYPWPSLATSPYRSSPLVGLQGLWGKHYASDEEVKTAVLKSLKEQSTEFYMLSFKRRTLLLR